MRVAAKGSPGIGGLLDAVVGISDGLDLETVLRRLVEAATQHTGARFGALGVLGPDGLHEMFIHVGLPEEVAARLGHLPAGRGVLGLITREQAVVKVPDIAAHPAAVGFPPGHPPMTTFLGVPLRIRDEAYGNLYLADKEGGFTERDTDTVQTLAAAAAVAIDNARLFRGVARREAWATAAHQVSTALLEGTDEEDALSIVAGQARLVANARMAALVLPSLDGHPIVEVVDADEEADLIGVAIPDDVRPEDPRGDGGWLVRDLASTTADPVLSKYGPAMVAALADSAGQMGMLLLAREVGAQPFSAGDLTTASSFASQAALALRLASARRHADVLALYEERQRIARDLHDLAVQQLFASGMELSRLRRSPDADSEDWVTVLDSVLDGIDDAVTQIRATIRSLNGQDGTTLRERLDAETSRARAALGFVPAVAVEPPDGPAHALDDELVDDVAAVVREALSNVARHARASSAEVHVDIGPQILTVSIDDDGVGIGPDATAPGARRSGLANFEARARHHGGSVTVSRGTRGGTHVVWQVPLS